MGVIAPVTVTLIKRFVRRIGSCIELQQFNPAVTFSIDAAKVLRIDREILWGELQS